jgi:hypothetical protein
MGLDYFYLAEVVQRGLIRIGEEIEDSTSICGLSVE